jgi:hypothetical protein
MKKIIAGFVFAFLAIFTTAAQTPRDTAKTSVAMLNYLATESLTIEMSKDNRLVLSEIRRKIENITNPAIVDIQTQGYLDRLLQSLTNMSLSTIQRDRLEMIYENEKAQALSQSLPNPLYLLSMRNTNPLQLIASAALMTLDSFMRYKSASNSADFNYLLGNLDLKKEDILVLANLTGDYFNYMIDISRAYNLDVSESINRDSISNFVRYSLDDNLERRLQWFDDNRVLYANYGAYWLRLADTCYDLGLYDRCISAVQRYENIQTPVFRNDHDYASVIPKVILSASNIHGDSITYQRLAVQYLEKMLNNIIEEDWALRYFAAQAYISLAGIGNREQNLNSAYNLLVTNITYLSRKQEENMNQYLIPVTDDNTLPKRQREEAEKINKELRDKRSKELPPLHSGLVLHCQVIFALMDELNLNPVQRNRVKNILINTFFIPTYKNIYLGEDLGFSSSSFTIEKASTDSLLKVILLGVTVVGAIPFLLDNNWPGAIITIPSPYVTSDTKININITEGNNILYNITDSLYAVKKVTRTQDQNINNFATELSTLFYSEAEEEGYVYRQKIKINKNQEYKFTLTLDTHGVSCNLIFSSPVGRRDFIFVNVD